METPKPSHVLIRHFILAPILMARNFSRKDTRILRRVLVISLAIGITLLTQLSYMRTPPHKSRRHLSTEKIYISTAAEKLLLRHNYPINKNPPSGQKFILYRALGNSLPPRHHPNQTYDNLLFTLLHEPDLPNVEKRWYINRLLNQSEETKLIKLLLAHNQTFIVDSINWRHYRTLQHGVDEYEHDPLHRIGYPKKLARRLARVRDSLLHEKILYVMNNNGARNMMLELGFASGAEFVMPFDGNVFICSDSWNSIIRGNEDGDGGKYFVVPMVRVKQNEEVCQNIMEAKEEPQVIFRKDSEERFNESLRYGRRPKVELLWRLGVEGIWTNVALLPGETRVRATGTGIVKSVGWCTRLQDGVTVDGTDAGWREDTRSVGVEQALGWGDWYANRVEGEGDGILFDLAVLRKLRKDFRDGVRDGCVARVLHRVPNVDHDGCDVDAIHEVCEDVVALSVAGFITENEELGKRATKRILTFVERAKGEGMKVRKLAKEVLPAVPLLSMVESVNLLKSSDAISSGEVEVITSWFREFGDMVEDLGWGVSHGADGAWYDLFMAGIGALVRDYRYVVRGGSFARLRLRNGRIEPDGEVWRLLAKVGTKVGVEWEHVLPDADDDFLVPFSWLVGRHCKLQK